MFEIARVTQSFENDDYLVARIKILYEPLSKELGLDSFEILFQKSKFLITMDDGSVDFNVDGFKKSMRGYINDKVISLRINRLVSSIPNKVTGMIL